MLTSKSGLFGLILLTLSSTIQSIPLIETANDSTPSPYPLTPSNKPIIDSQSACDALAKSIPPKLSSLKQTDYSEPFELTNVFTKLYLNGDNPSTTELYQDIPTDELKNFNQTSLEQIIQGVGDWNRTALMADEQYGLEDTVQTQSGGLPSFCRFGASIKTTNSSSTWFETWMPVPSNTSTMTNNSMGEGKRGGASRDNWQGRLVYVGSGGLKGSVSYPEMKQVLARYREATASSNLGHFGTNSDSSWQIGNVEEQIDFAYRGTHVAALASQFIVQEFYNVSPTTKKEEKSKHSFKPHFGFPVYYKGCSTGGRQGMAAAQRFPFDFDGVLSGSPAIYFNELNAWNIHVNAFQSNSSSPRYIPFSLYPVIHDFVLSECDTLDGIQDAVIENPHQCKPQLERLLCDTAPEGKCLTNDQLANLKDIYTDYRYPSGEIIRAAVLYGSETRWTSNGGVVGTPFPPAAGWYQYQVLNETGPQSDFDYYKIVNNNFTLIKYATKIDPAGMETNNPDMTKFFSKGGKLMHYHGLADELITSGGSDLFFKKIHETVKRDISNSYRYFHIPGMGHCNGGDGAWNFGGASQIAVGSRPFKFTKEFDMLLSLFDWVEKGQTPKEQWGASYKVTNGSEPIDYVTNTNQTQTYANGIKFTHKLCPYPSQVVVKHNSTSTQRCEVVDESRK